MQRTLSEPRSLTRSHMQSATAYMCTCAANARPRLRENKYEYHACMRDARVRRHVVCVRVCISQYSVRYEQPRAGI